MKHFVMLCILVGTMLIITPLIGVRYERVVNKRVDEEIEIANSKIIKVMSSENGFIKEVETREYLIGCVAGEMSASYHKEALKAQAVAAHTYAAYISQRDAEILGGADISDDNSLYQSYINMNERKEKWGDNFEKNEKIISDAVDEVLFCYLTYNDHPALTTYHNICTERTESAENVWGEAYPYLISVTSIGDKLSPDYISESKISIEKFKSVLEKNKIEYSDSILIKSRFDSGYVKILEIGKSEITGSEFREMFSLRSADFDVKIKDDQVTFECRGNGHFVGMSQYGADYMARQGFTFDEILSHYYPGTELELLKT